MPGMAVIRQCVTVCGTVQGVGFRPLVWRLARRHGLAGWVANEAAAVRIDVQGPAAAVDAFLDELAAAPPPLAVVTRFDREPLPVDPNRSAGFSIRLAAAPAAGGPSAAVVLPPDTASCPACLADVEDPGNRRHRYPFTSCTDCGPRFTIVRSMPYERPHTTMAAFTMCRDCAAEYADPHDRRFHAQPNACAACGPSAWFTTAADVGGIARSRAAARCLGDAAVAAVRHRLRAGDIVAVKGLGGFHLMCDATSGTAVARLRARKRRGGRPLAVMVVDAATAGRVGVVDGEARRILESPERPIVLVPKRPGGGGLAAAVAPDNDFVGLMLPALPLQHLLCAGMPPLVATSGNLAEEPIAHDNADAADRLAALADGFLMHDREIVVPCDDSVVRCVAGAMLPLRRSRGFVPRPLRLTAPGPAVLAVGGELSTTLCYARGAEAIPSQHVGDVANAETLAALDRTAAHLLALSGGGLEAVACDLHPGSLSAAWARRFAADRRLPCVPVQHHEAHLASLLAEQARADMPVLGVCFDGTGFGRDRTIQGGEFLVAPAGLAGGFRRGAHLATFPLPGGDAAIRHPWRTALAVLHAAGCEWSPVLAPVAAAAPAAVAVLRRQCATGFLCTPTSSMGRLFDAVAAVAGVRQSIEYEAEAALCLEALAGGVAGGVEAYPFPVEAGDPLELQWRPLVRAVVADVRGGVAAAVIAARFHETVAAAIATVCGRLRAATGIATVGLTGGVFQNAVLVRRAVAALEAAGFAVLLHGRVPPNDGGLAVGQAVLARQALAAAPAAVSGN